MADWLGSVVKIDNISLKVVRENYRKT